MTSVVATETTIQLTWETSDRACVKHFGITVTGPDSTLSRQPLKEESSDTFEDVWPCRTYNVTLETRNNASVVVDQDMRSVDTAYLEPGELQLSITNRTNADTQVSWTDPINKSCISSFTIVWRRNGCISDEDQDTTTATTEQDDETTTASTDDWTGLTTVSQDFAMQSEPKGECLGSKTLTPTASPFLLSRRAPFLSCSLFLLCHLLLLLAPSLLFLSLHLPCLIAANLF